MKKLIALILSSPFAALAAIQPIEIVPLEKLPFALVEVEFDGFGKTKMIVDTGASETVLAQWFTEQAKIPLLPESGEGQDSGGVKFKTRKTAGATLEIGENKKYLSGFHVVPTPVEFKLGDIGGFLSPQTYFEGETFMLDFPSKKILGGKFTRKWVRGKKKIDRITLKPCSLDNNTKYLVDLKINGIPGSFYLDTGGSRSAITRAFKAKLSDVHGVQAKRTGVASKRNVERLQGLDLELGRVNRRITADVEPDRVACRYADGKLGHDFLGKYTLLFDKKREYLTIFK